MNTIQTIFAAVEQHAGLLLVSLAVWATVVLGVAWLMAARMRRAAPSVRYCVWQFALTGLLGVPLVFVALPGIPLGMKLPTVASESSPPVPNQKAALAASTTGRLHLPVAHEPAGTSPPNFTGATPLSDRSQDPTAESPKLKSKSATQSVSAKNAAIVPPATMSGSGASAAQRWQVWLLSIWFLGAAIQAIWLFVAAGQAWSLARGAIALPDERFQKSLAELQRRLSIRRQVRLRSTDRVCLPVVVGAVRPTILLPANCWEWSDERIRMALVHELAHVERRDVFWQITARVAAAIYWFHPLVWLAVRRMRQERERACDDRVLSSGVEATDYASGLVEVAAALRGRRLRMPVAVGMAHSSHLEDRVRSILNPSQSRGPISRRLRRMILLATAGIVLALGIVRPFGPIHGRAAETPPSATKATGAGPVAKPEPAKPVSELGFDKNGDQVTSGKMQLQILDPAGKPFSGAHIHASVWTRDRKFKASRDYKSDAHGRIDIVLPQTLYILRLWADGPSCVSQFIDWEQSQPIAEKHIPEQLTIRMQRGIVIGGTVLDERNNPIAGAAMLIESKLSGLLSDGDVKTDAHGRWKLDTYPPDDNSEVRVVAKHPDYVNMRSYFNLSDEKPVPIKDLREQTVVTVLKHGVRVTGKITSPDGKPVFGALAIWGDDPYFEAFPKQEVRTDKQGVYRLPPLPLGPMRLTIVAKGWMPEMRMLQITRANPPVDFRLKPGKTLRVRVVDERGNPVSHAWFGVDEWRGAKSLFNELHPNVKDSKIPRGSNNQGIYEWTWAPDDAVKFTISAAGNSIAREVSFTADNQEHKFVLQSALNITGRVSDARTGRPVDKFTIVRVDDFGNGLYAVEWQDAAVQHGGKFALKPQDRTDAAIRVRIEADGYRTAMSGPFRVGDSKTTWDFKLEPAPALRGRVLQAGHGVVGVKVYLATQSQGFDWPRDKFQVTNNYSVTTNGQGEFSFPAQFEQYRLFAISDGGYADIACLPDQSPGDLELKKWAHVEGRLFQAGKPVPNSEIFLDIIDTTRFAGKPYVQCRQSAETDAEGRFVFDRVPPKECTVCAALSPWEEFSITSSQHIPLDLRPGQHVTINLGGDGIPVTGQVVLKGDAKGIDLNWSLNYLLRMKPGIEPPEEIRAMGFDWRRGWNESWDDTQEGREYLGTLQHDFVRLHSDGKLLINGVSAGDYQLALRIYKHDDPKACLTEPIAERVVKFTVTPADVAKGGLNLGTIEVEAMRVPQPGEIVPDFEFAKLDGPAKKLSEFRGKYVLADFWATWCGECVAALPNVHHLEEKYGSDGRFVVVPISLDDDLNALRRFVADRKLQGIQGSLGDWSKTNLPARLGVSSLPTYLLIGPDGKLIVNAWSVDQVSGKLSGVLKSAAAR